MSSDLPPLERAAEIGVVPVVALADVDMALPLADALTAGGLPCAEITFRTDAAAKALTRLRQDRPGLLLGAGTVLTTRQVDLAIDAGAQFIVAPGTNSTLVEYVQARGVPMLPGVATPTEIEAALARGIELVKFFPAEPFGGVPTLRAFAGPYRSVRYVPTGGISPRNLGAYLALPSVAACGGSWMVRPELLAARDFDTITRLAREAVAIVANSRAGRSAAHG